MSVWGYDRYASSRAIKKYPPQGDVINIGGLEVHTLCRGTGDKTLVLFHGFAGGAIDMLPLMDRLGSYKGLIFVAKAGLLRPMAGSFVSADHADYDPALLTQMRALRSRSRTIVAFAEEGSLAARGLTSTALASSVSRMNVPLLLIASEQTDVPEGRVFCESLRVLNDEYPQALLISIPEARHYAIVTHAGLIAGYILSWMSAH